MPTLDELRLARAKAMCQHVHDTCPALITGAAPLWDDRPPEEQEWFLDQARAIEAADAALGVVSVPREATDAMCRSGNDWTNCGGACGNQSAYETWSAMLAASPLREKSDEQ